MKFIGYKCEFNGKINEIHILINEKSNREILGFFKISQDISRPKIEPGSRELNPTAYWSTSNSLPIGSPNFSAAVTSHAAKSLNVNAPLSTIVAYMMLF